MHKNMRRLFPAPCLAADEDAEAEIRALFGITEEPATEPPAPVVDSSATPLEEPAQETPAEGTETPPQQEENPPQEEQNPQTQQQDTVVNPEEKFSKQNHAFAQLRVENKALADLVMNLAKASGQTPRNVAEAQEMLQQGLTKIVSKNRNIPEEALREMEADKLRIAQLEQDQARQKALAGFQKVKDTYQLSREEVNAFTDRLIENKINPFEQEIDLVKEYKNLYFDELIAKAVERGVQAERARSLKAQQNSTTPPAQTGGTGTGTVQPIKSVKDLDAFLDSLK